ncbi:neuroligin-2 [Caerostris extrusa]|uniref:Neuroligin-2 n=1 Tax=Caerostris extrusa TaxID=172846 RepID=A0AAV4NEF6_CAEEX|nr:neuroligin-2 [Caerostris extrusa]
MFSFPLIVSSVALGGIKSLFAPVVGFLPPWTTPPEAITASWIRWRPCTGCKRTLRNSGNPKNVTVFGHGTGAAFVNLLMLSPLARGLFQRGVLQSGSALSPWAIARDALTYTKQVAAHLNALQKDSAALITCLGKRPIDDILNAPLRIPDHLIAFGPTIDGVVIPGEPADLMEKQTEFFFTIRPSYWSQQN